MRAAASSRIMSTSSFPRRAFITPRDVRARFTFNAVGHSKTTTWGVVNQRVLVRRAQLHFCKLFRIHPRRWKHNTHLPLDGHIIHKPLPPLRRWPRAGA